MTELFAPVRRTGAGQLVLFKEDVTRAVGKAMMIRRDADDLVPAALRRTLSHVSRLVLLYAHDTPKSAIVKSPGKQPIAKSWPTVVLTEKQVIEHVLAGGNLGIRAGDGLVILDFDAEAAEAAMMERLGPLAPTVITGKGRRHYYVKVPAEVAGTLPAKIVWMGQTIGEVQRTNSQQVVCPPSIHPETKGVYQWAGPANPLPEKWLKALLANAGQRARHVVAESIDELPSYIKPGDARGHEADGSDWDGPAAEEIVRRAWLLPGARRRSTGVKAQCLGCHREGHDKKKDNALIVWDGRWSCALNADHKRDIGESLGIVRTRLLDHNDGPLRDRQDPDGALLDSPDGDLMDGPDGPLMECE